MSFCHQDEFSLSLLTIPKYFFFFKSFAAIILEYNSVITKSACLTARARVAGSCPGEASPWVPVPPVEAMLVTDVDRSFSFQ